MYIIIVVSIIFDGSHCRGIWAGFVVSPNELDGFDLKEISEQWMGVGCSVCVSDSGICPEGEFTLFDCVLIEMSPNDY